MTNACCIPGLVKKRAELAGGGEARPARLDQLRADFAHPDAATRIMGPSAAPELAAAKKAGRRGCDWFGRGELGRLALEALRDVPGPLGTREAALAVLDDGRCGGRAVRSSGDRRFAER